MRHNSINLARKFVMSVMIGVLCLSATSTTRAAGLSYGVQVNQAVICIVIEIIFVTFAGRSTSGNSNGNGQVTITSATEAGADNTHRAEYVPNSISVTSQVNGVGAVVTALDPTRTPTTSSIEGNNVGSDFPAHEDLYFYSTATVNGVVYESVNELHLSAEGVTAFPRHNNTAFTLVQPVDFRDRTTGQVAFTLTSIQATFN